MPEGIPARQAAFKEAVKILGLETHLEDRTEKPKDFPLSGNCVIGIGHNGFLLVRAWGPDWPSAIASLKRKYQNHEI